MSLGGEAIRDTMTQRERDLLDEVWVWRAVQVLAYRSPSVSAEIRIDPRTEMTMVFVNSEVYFLPNDRGQLLADARSNRDSQPETCLDNPEWDR